MLSIITPYEVAQDPSKGAQVVTQINAMVDESWNAGLAWNIVDHMLDNLNLHLYGRTTNTKRRLYEIPMIGDVNIANAAIQVGDRPKVSVEPRETGEAKISYLNPAYLDPASGLAGPVLARLNIVSPESRDLNNQQPLNPTEVALVQSELAKDEALKMQSMQAGLPEPPGMLPPDIVITIDDHAMADAAKTLIESKCDESGLTRALVENATYNNIFGYQFMLCEFDSDEKRFQWKNPEPIVVHVDPFKTDIRYCQYVIYDEFLGAEEAAQLYPELIDAIEQNATQGPPTLPGMIPYRVPLPWYQALMGRKVVIVRSAWLRNQPYKLTPEEALAKKKIIARPKAAPTPEEQATEKQKGTLRKVLSAFGIGKDKRDEAVKNIETSRDIGPEQLDPTMEGPGTTEQNQLDSAGGTNDPDNLEEAGNSPDSAGDDDAEEGGRDTPAGLGQSYFLVNAKGVVDEKTGPITPDHAKWPIQRAIRQIRIIASTLVEDAKCERADIPVGHNVNRAIPFTPWGQSDAEMLEPIQRAYNNTFSDNMIHGSLNAFPPTLVDQTIANKYPDLMTIGRSDARRVFPVDTDLVKRLGVDKLMWSLKMGELPKDNWERLKLLESKFDKQSQQSEILRGELPGQSAMSGDAISRLQNYAKTSIQFKGSRMEDMMEYLGPIILGDLLNGLTTAELADCVRKYPPVVWPELHHRLLRHYLNCTVRFELASGTGAANNGETNQLIDAAAKGVPVSPQELLTRLNLDPEAQLNNTVTWQRKTQGAIQGAAPGAQAPPAPAPTVQPPAPPPPSLVQTSGGV